MWRPTPPPSASSNAALFRQPPFLRAARVALLYLERNAENEPPRRERWSFARFQLLVDRQQSFESIGSYSPASLDLSGAGEGTAELVRGERVSPSYFRVLGATARHGRLFADSEKDPAQPSPDAVLGEELWTSVAFQPISPGNYLEFAAHSLLNRNDGSRLEYKSRKH